MPLRILKKHYPTWKLIAEICLIIIVLISVVEVMHNFYHVEIDSLTLRFIELIDYLAIIVLFIDLFYHYSASKKKEKFLKKHWLHILSFIPYLIFIKAAGILKLLKIVFTGIGKIIKIVFHKESLKKRLDEFEGKKKVIKEDKLE